MRLDRRAQLRIALLCLCGLAGNHFFVCPTETQLHGKSDAACKSTTSTNLRRSIWVRAVVGPSGVPDVEERDREAVAQHPLPAFRGHDFAIQSNPSPTQGARG